MAESKSEAKKTRRLKNASPVTVRQQIENKQTDDKPNNTNKPSNKSVIKAIFSVVTRFGKLLKFNKLARLFGFMKPVGRVLYKIFGIGYFTSSFKELKQVTWPNRKQTRQLTTAVIIFAVIFGLLIAGVDYGLDKLFKIILTD